MPETGELIFGKNAVTEAVRAGSPIDEIYIAKDSRFFGEMAAVARKNGIIYKSLDNAQLTKLCGTDKNGGVAARLSSVQYCTVDDILAVAEEKGEPPFIIICDEIEDPHNLGAIIRTAEAAGAHGVIIPKRRSAAVNATVYKTSAGAAAWIKIARVTNLCETLKYLKQKNIWIYGAEADGVSVTDTELYGASALVIGSEGYGLGRLVRENCDVIVSLPMFGKVNSLNASVSAGILMYEYVRGREKKAERKQ
ncbi:MAG: 23S rRNA (guanosine(2251)-2'-O)-methyltransferase RlmB [Eubacterium sp.]|nr:23S rRNA (guanosine(2251)-2'-O)-methyltransferase RlmB [Eubacterium sp.]